MYTEDSHSTGKMKETALSLAPYLGSSKEIGSAVKYKDGVTDIKRKRRIYFMLELCYSQRPMIYRTIGISLPFLMAIQMVLS